MMVLYPTWNNGEQKSYSDGEQCGYDRGVDEGYDKGYDEGFAEALRRVADELLGVVERLNI